MDFTPIIVIVFLTLIVIAILRSPRKKGDFQYTLREVKRLTEACSGVGMNYAEMGYSVTSKDSDWTDINKELTSILPYALKNVKKEIKRARKNKASAERISNLVQTHLSLKNQLKICKRCQKRQEGSKNFNCPFMNENKKEAWLNENGDINV